MKVAVFSAKPYDIRFLEQGNQVHGHELAFFEPHLTRQTTELAKGFEAVCVFTNDTLDRPTLTQLFENGTRVVALRCAGFNNVDLAAADELGIRVVRVPAYSPYAVAEHTVTLMMALNRKVHRAFNRVREGNFALDGLMGFDFHGKTAGIIGTGKIGEVVASILKGLGCRVLAYDLSPNPECVKLGVEYASLEDLFRQSDIITLHCPLTPQTHYLVNAYALEQMKQGVMLINTSRGGIIDTNAVIHALKSGKIGYLGLDVYEEEADLFFEDLSDRVIQDDVFMRLLTFPNVLITGHQAFFTQQAMENITDTTLQNLTDLAQGNPCENELTHAKTVATAANR